MGRICPISLLLILCLAAISCKPQKINLLLKETDSLQQEIFAVNRKINDANLDSINQVYSILRSEHIMISENFSQLPENIYDKELVERFDSTVLVIGLCLDACNDFQQELSVIEGHLEMIRNDISEGQEPDSSIAERIITEAELFSELKARIFQRLDILHNHLRIYNELEPEIQSYIEPILRDRSDE